MEEEKTAAEAKVETSLAKADLQARRVSDLEGEMAVLRADFEIETTARESLQAELDEEKAEGVQRIRELHEAVSKSTKQSALLQSLSDRLAAAEQGVEVAKVDAVEAFKDSQAFADAVAECSADSYRLGFADCKEAMSRLHPCLDLSAIHPPGGEESSGEEAPEEESAEEERVEQEIADFVEVIRADEGGDADEATAEAPAPVEAEENPSGGSV